MDWPFDNEVAKRSSRIGKQELDAGRRGSGCHLVREAAVVRKRARTRPNVELEVEQARRVAHLVVGFGRRGTGARWWQMATRRGARGARRTAW